MENLHADVLENILFRLPVDATIQAKRVCTTWRAIIRKKTENPGGFLFAHYHLQPHATDLKHLFYEDEYDHHHHSKMSNYYSDNNFITEIEHSRSITKSVPKHFMVGSCNGLVCFGRDVNINLHDRDLFLICNPLTGESVFLPGLNHSEWPRDTLSTRVGALASGFGYCPSTGTYKIVTIFYCKEEREGGHVLVYTLGTRKWRYVGLTGHRCEFNYSSAISANGALFWLHHISNYRVKESEVVAFDLEGEKFHYIALPRSKDFEDTSFCYSLKLLVGNNNLYLVHLDHRADIWVYKRDSGLSHWLKEFSIKLEFPRFFEALAITLWVYKCKSLYWYDPKTSTFNKLRDIDNDVGIERVYVEAIPHTQSNVSLKDLGETNVYSLKDFGQASKV